jgi:hypothetical protein
MFYSLNIFDIAKFEKGLACQRYGICDTTQSESRRDLNANLNAHLESRGLSLGPLFKFGVSFLPSIIGLLGGGSSSKRADAASTDWVKMANTMEEK